MSRATTDDLRHELVFVLLGACAVAGLYVDGWSHRFREDETFFTSSHALLYGGFVAAVAWLAGDTGCRSGRADVR